MLFRMNTMRVSNGLDIEAIAPERGGKFSPNLYKWLTSKKRPRRRDMSRVYADKDGTLWIGFLDDDYLIGTRLMQVLCSGTKAESYAWCIAKSLTQVTDFWQRYMRDGRCAIDTTHTQFFIGDETRWHRDGDRRSCLWCRHCEQELQRDTKTALVERWI